MSFNLTWYGHAALGLEIDGHSVLVDPFLKDNPAASIRPEQVPADYILVSHGHNDHLGDTIDIARRTGAPVISNDEISTWLDKQGLKTHHQHIGGGLTYPFGYLKLTLAVHGSRLPDGEDGGNPVGFLLSTPDGKKVYLSGDTGLFGDMRLIGEEGLDLAVIPIGDCFTMGPEDALKAVNMLRPRHVIPIHFNTFAIIQQDADAWAQRVQGETQSEVHVLKPGESFTL